MSRRTRLVLITSVLIGLFAAVVILLGDKAGRSLLTPGPLAPAHAHLEGEQNCAQCHVGGSGLSNALCLKCHEPIQQRINAKQGFHAKLDLTKQGCNECHSDHHGDKLLPIRWPAKDAPFAVTPAAAKNKRDDFPHEAGTGFAISGAHAPLGCDGCHTDPLVSDPKLVKYQQEKVKDPGEQTYLGLATSCGGCHQDPHRPTQGNDCGKCHDDEKFKPSPRFEHKDTRFALEGKHATDVKCEECHLKPAPTQAPALPTPPLPTFKAVVSKTNPRPFRGVGFGKAPATPVLGEILPSCINCHENVHRSGSKTFIRCSDCHTPAKWDQSPTATFVHDEATTGFELTGAHKTKAKCADCHGPKLNDTSKESCLDCHRDDYDKGHNGKSFDREMALLSQGCEACHDTNDWKPSSYSKKDHANRTKANLPLIDKHDTKCEKCHDEPKFTRLPTQPGSRAKLGPLRNDCASCHTDKHEGRLGKDCASCHNFKEWILAPFTNAQHAEIGFPITGVHAKADVKCKDCHSGRNPNTGGLKTLSLAQVKVQGCVACHGEDDPHKGQLSKKCADCHTEEKAWSPSTYTVAKHAATRLPLTDAHKAVPCEVCHVRDLPPAPKLVKKAQRFKWTPHSGKLDCAVCHDDPHKGQFQRQTCASCHSYKGFIPATFDAESRHKRLSFPLVGPHDIGCAKCHVTGFKHGKAVTYKGTPLDCAGCHQDPHAGQFADRRGGCLGCHGEAAWTPTTFDHNKKPCRFPLEGKHKQAKCTTCHLSSTRKLSDGVAKKVVHYYPIKKQGCGDCHENPHDTGGKSE